MALAQNLWGAWDLAMRMREPAYLCADICMKVKSESEVAQSYPTLSNPMDCSLPGYSVHGTSYICIRFFPGE